MPTYTSSPPTYHSATQSTPVYNTHRPNPNAQRQPQHTGGAQNNQPRTDRGRPQVPPLFESEEREPLLPRNQATSSKLSLEKILLILLIVAAFSLYHLGWWVHWDAGCQNRNLVQWEQELKLKKMQEKQREVRWDRQVDSNREQERLREAQREARDLEWGRQMDDKREQERIREAQWHMSQEQRERLGLHWDEPFTGSCISHGVRSYQARLLDAASYSYNPIVPCREMPLDIQGVSVKASYCESKGNEIWGHWNVENDPLCTPVFQAWREDACVAPGSRRRLASARLDYITKGEDALQLCASTPIRFKDMYFDRPLSCAWSTWGLWGHWEYDDNNC